jgi:hypothetical protein
MLEKYRNLSRIRRLSERFIPFPVELLGVGVEFGQKGIC